MRGRAYPAQFVRFKALVRPRDLRAGSQLLLATLVSCGIAKTDKQPSATPPASAAQTSEIARWMIRPTAIALSPDQQKAFDRFTAQYDAEAGNVINATGAADDRMGSIVKLRALQLKYRDLVRPILTSTQQAVFDANTEVTLGKRD